MGIRIEVKDLLEDMQKYIDLMEYLNFAFEYVQHVYEVDVNCDFGLNYAYQEKFGKKVPNGYSP